MKKLCPTAFVLLILGVSLNIFCAVMNFTINVMQIDEALATVNTALPGLYTDDMLQIVRNLTIVFMIIGLLIALGLSGYFMFAILRNKKKPTGQGYITFIFVVAIIALVFSGLGLILGAWLSILNVGLNVLLIVGCRAQQKFAPPAEIENVNVDVFGHDQ